jgi:hypothetical protein
VAVPLLVARLTLATVLVDPERTTWTATELSVPSVAEYVALVSTIVLGAGLALDTGDAALAPAGAIAKTSAAVTATTDWPLREAIFMSQPFGYSVIDASMSNEWTEA